MPFGFVEPVVFVWLLGVWPLVWCWERFGRRRRFKDSFRRGEGVRLPFVFRLSLVQRSALVVVLLGLAIVEYVGVDTAQTAGVAAGATTTVVTMSQTERGTSQGSATVTSTTIDLGGEVLGWSGKAVRGPVTVTYKVGRLTGAKYVVAAEPVETDAATP